MHSTHEISGIEAACKPSSGPNSVIGFGNPLSRPFIKNHENHEEHEVPFRLHEGAWVKEHLRTWVPRDQPLAAASLVVCFGDSPEKGN